MPPSFSSGIAKLHSELFDSVFDGNLSRFKELADSLLEEGEGPADVVQRVITSDGLTTFHVAANTGKTNICTYLAEQVKLDPNVNDEKGLTPLHHSILADRHQTAVYLLENGGDPNAATDIGLTALHFAAERGSKKLLQLLLAKGAKVDAKAVCGTPLHSAALKGKKESVKILLDNKADPNATVHHVFSPLMMSIKGQSIECLKMLLKAGANPNVETRSLTPLIMAACEGETDMIKCLLNAEANPNAISDLGLTPLEYAALRGSHQDVMVLLRVTSRIPSISDWSLSGVMKHGHSEEARRQRTQKLKEIFLKSKSNGNDAFKKKDYLGAAYWYTDAISADPSNAAVLSNRSICYARLNEGEHALEDAQACVTLSPEWSKAHYRLGMAYRMLKNFEKAEVAFFEALMLDPANEEIERAHRDMRMENGRVTMTTCI